MFDIKQEIDRVTKEYKRRYMPETITDPECRTEAYQRALDMEVVRLLQSPESLLEVDTDALVAIYKAHNGDLLDLGECIHQYFLKLAEEQAEESI